ncbi:MAG: M24 family metallopeptidase [Desulfosoma sp.]|uniref:M24 family metallopeptidase n=1 Tax=Desulfosoma sp. TaxID=2603217 RepID=UPI00404B52F8
MIPEPFATRLRALRTTMETLALDTMLITVPENRYYLSGFRAEDMYLTESSGQLFIGMDRQALLTDFRYEEQAASEAQGYELVIYREGWTQVLPDLLRSFRTRRLGVEAHHLTLERFRQLEQALRDVCPQGELWGEEALVEKLRMIKTASEIETMRQALRLTEAVFAQVWQDLGSGRTEKQVAWAIEKGLREAGAEGVAFPPIVASGPNGALPHAVPTDRRIREEDAVIVDLGARYNLYCSDMTRTWLGPKVPQKLKEIYRIVQEAQRAAMEAIRAGVDSHAVDGVARRIINGGGYGSAFGHGLGHGIGLAVHEKPGYGKKTSVVLQENMVLTVEPGIYVTGLGGVRLENMVRVTATGCDCLSRNEWFLDDL